MKYRCLFLELLSEANFSKNSILIRRLVISAQRRDDRVADCASLERMCGGNSTEGSNPSLSAIFLLHKLGVLFNASWYDSSLCKRDLEFNREYHADHIIPYSSGGETKTSNGQALCYACNIRKSNSF